MLQTRPTPDSSIGTIPPGTLSLARELLIQLESRRVRYCHWKSNESLPAALRGVGDLDLLVDGRDSAAFQSVLFRLGFQQAEQRAWLVQPSIRHYYGLDTDTGRLLHVHVYFRLITGGVVLKNYRLPFESQLIEQSQIQHGVPVPPRSVELLVFVLRKMLEASDPVELLLQRWDDQHVRREWRWLIADGEKTISQAQRWLERWLPQVDTGLFRQAVRSLSGKTSLWRRFLLGRRFRRALQPLALRGPVVSVLASRYRTLRRLMARAARCSGKRLATGGRVVALVGPEASGKSTAAGELQSWLRPAFGTVSAHMGKPRSTWLSVMTNALRRGMKRVRRRRSVCDSHGWAMREGWLYGLASVLLARERARACQKAHRKASQGHVVICDRYPHTVRGMIDGPRIDPTTKRGVGGCLWRWLSRVETHYYGTVLRPDITLRLAVPVEVALRRNRQRVKADKESDEYLVQRHLTFGAGCSAFDSAIEVETGGPKQDVMLRLKQDLWRRL